MDFQTEKAYRNNKTNFDDHFCLKHWLFWQATIETLLYQLTRDSIVFSFYFISLIIILVWIFHFIQIIFIFLQWLLVFVVELLFLFQFVFLFGVVFSCFSRIRFQHSPKIVWTVHAKCYCIWFIFTQITFLRRATKSQI